MKLKGKTAIVTGAASGIGRAIALRFAQEGATVVIADVDEKGSNKTLAELSSKGMFVRTDVIVEDEIKHLVSQTVEKYGPLDILVNSVGIYEEDGDIPNMDEEDFRNIMDTNFKSIFFTTKHTLPHLEKTGGNIVTISSAIGLVPEPESPVYCSSKAAINMFTKATALNYAKKNVRINAICPGPIDTPLLRSAFASKKELEEYLQRNPMKRVGRPEEVANVALFLASNEASYVTGGIYTVDGGESLT